MKRTKPLVILSMNVAAVTAGSIPAFAQNTGVFVDHSPGATFNNISVGAPSGSGGSETPGQAPGTNVGVELGGPNINVEGDQLGLELGGNTNEQIVTVESPIVNVGGPTVEGDHLGLEFGGNNSEQNVNTGGVTIGGDNFESFSFGATNGVSSAVRAAANKCNEIINKGKAFNVGAMGGSFGFANSKGQQLPADVVCEFVMTALQNWLNGNDHARRMFEQDQRYQFEYMVLGLKHWLNYPAEEGHGEGQAPANLQEEHNGFAKSFLIQNVDGLRTNFMARMLAISALDANNEPDDGRNPLYYQRIMEVVLLGIPARGIEPTIKLAMEMDPLKRDFSAYMERQREIAFPDATEFFNNVRNAEQLMNAAPQR